MTHFRTLDATDALVASAGPAGRAASPADAAAPPGEAFALLLGLASAGGEAVVPATAGEPAGDGGAAPEAQAPPEAPAEAPSVLETMLAYAGVLPQPARAAARLDGGPPPEVGTAAPAAGLPVPARTPGDAAPLRLSGGPSASGVTPPEPVSGEAIVAAPPRPAPGGAAPTPAAMPPELLAAAATPPPAAGPAEAPAVPEVAAPPLQGAPAAVALAAAPAPVAAAPVVVAVQTPAFAAGWHEETASKVAAVILRGHERAEVRLAPADLGPVDVRLEVRAGEATLTIVAAHPATRDALEQALPMLKDLLAQQGLSLGEASVRDGRPDDASAQRGAPTARASPRDADEAAPAPPAGLRARRLVDTFA